MTKAWHFLGDDGLMRDGRPAPADGEWLEHKGPIEICRSGLHASTRLIDALDYAPGALLCRVEVEGVENRHDDKLVARRRKILWRIDSEPVLRDFARRCALDVVHLWDAPDVVVQYLQTGDESLRSAVRDAARSAAWSAAWSAAGSAAWSAILAAARDAAWSAAWSDAGSAAWSAILAAARDAAWSAARDAAGSAAWSAAGAAARSAAWSAAGAAARDKFNRRLTSMVVAAHKKEQNDD